MEGIRRFLGVQRLAFALFAGVLLVTGWRIVDDYGIGWDEPVQLEIGLANYRYLVRADPALWDLKDRHYGPLFEIFLVRMMDQSSPRAMYISRHFWNFAAFWAGVVGFYLLLRSMYPRRWLPLFGAALLVFSPRLFADAFYNSKDIPFLVMIVWTMLALSFFLRQPSLIRLLLVSLSTAASMAIRLPGVFLLALVALMIVREVLAGRLSLRRAVEFSILYLFFTAGLVFLFYPVFWHDPIGEIRQAFEILFNFPHFASVLYLGHFLSPQELPWHYLPVWIGITTPIPYQVLMLAGIGRAVRDWFSRPKSLLAAEQTPCILSALWLGLPAGAVILLGSPMYDGWRQMFFIYPALLIFAVGGGDSAWFTDVRRLAADVFHLPGPADLCHRRLGVAHRADSPAVQPAPCGWLAECGPGGRNFTAGGVVDGRPSSLPKPVFQPAGRPGYANGQNALRHGLLGTDLPPRSGSHPGAGPASGDPRPRRQFSR